MQPVTERFLQRVWGDQKGYVFLPYKDGEEWHERLAISYGGGDDFPDYPPGADGYYCPNVYRQRTRRKGGTEQHRWLYADLDSVDPRRLDLRPTIAVRTSGGRYQALWELVRYTKPDRFEDLNRRLTYATGADRGGWSVTKVLRPPGTLNYKYPRPQRVRLLWDEDLKYSIKQIEDYVSGVESHELDPEVQGLILPAESRESIIRGIRDRLDARARTLLFEDKDQPEGERSERLWELECRLLEAGLPPNEVFVVVRETVWNARGERRSDDHLWRDVQKAHLHVATQSASTEESGSLVRVRPRVVTYADLLTAGVSEPDWLIEDFWTLGSHGIVAGLPKSYKSLISLDMAVSVASETEFLGQYGVNAKGAGPVIIVQQENSMALLRDRLWKITKSRGLHRGNLLTGNNGKELVVEFPPSIPIMFYNDFGFDMSVPDDRQAIEELILKEGAKMIVFDPLYLMIGGADENNAKEMRPILSWLLRIRNLYNCSVVVVHHWGKGSTDRKGRGVGGIKLLGSTTIYGWLEAALYLEAKFQDSGIEVVVEREFRERLSPPPVGFRLNMGDVGMAGYEWSTQAPVGSHNKLLYVLSESEAALNYNRLQSATGWSMKKLRKELQFLLDEGTVVMEQEGKRKEFRVA